MILQSTKTVGTHARVVQRILDSRAKRPVDLHLALQITLQQL